MLHSIVANYDCPILSIGERKGDWGYIDFIAERELGQTAVMKGVDCVGRAFIVIKAEFVLEQDELACADAAGASASAGAMRVPVFVTLFQKYVNNKNIWQCFNYKGMELLYTSHIGDGYPITDAQMGLIQKLLNEKKVEICNANSNANAISGNNLELFYSQEKYTGLRLRCDRISSYY